MIKARSFNQLGITDYEICMCIHQVKTAGICAVKFVLKCNKRVSELKDCHLANMTNPTNQPSPFSLLSCLGGTDGSTCFSQANEPGLKLYGNDDIGLKAMGQEEEFLTPEFSNLSIQEQSKALHDLYRAGSELQEDPAMIDRLLTDFEHEIERGNHPVL